MEKKQSFISIAILGQLIDRADKRGSPLWTGPMICICWLIACKSCKRRHFPDFFFMTKMGVFHGDTEGLTCPNLSCSLTNSYAAVSFSEESGHWGTHTGSSVFHVIGIASSMAARKNPATVYRTSHERKQGWFFPEDIFLVLYLGKIPFSSSFSGKR